ncbi:MAG: ribonuclease J [Alphaproteobacteria bacterium]|nr:ribonuclease J [Alphaproteobacteria bacterium]
MTDLEFSKDDLVFVPVGGATGVGMNCFAYGLNGKWLVVDCGIGFPDDNLPGVDCLLPDPSFLAEHKADIVGLVITHAHEDHIGGIPYLWHDLQCPIYCTAFAKELIDSKLAEEGLLGRAEVHTVSQGDVIELPPFEIEFVKMTHSIPEPNALAIRTKAGMVVHTGDWRFEENASESTTDYETLKELGKEGVLAVVCDSTNTSEEKVKANEQDVQKNLSKLIGEHKNCKIAVGCFASNVVRMQSIYQAAKENNRVVCLLGRSLWRIDAAARATGYFKDIPEFLSEQEALELPSNKVLYICTGSQGERHSALNNLAAMMPTPNQVSFGAGDVVIFSSSVIPGNEKAIDLLQKKLRSKGIEIITEKTELVHISGHYAGDDLKKMYDLLKPHIVLPVHGDTYELNCHTQMAKEMGIPFAVGLNDGQMIALKETPEIVGEVKSGILAVDGNQIVPLNADVLKKRRKMMDEGTAVLTLVVDHNAQVVGMPQLSTFGLMSDDEAIKGELGQAIASALAEIDPERVGEDNLIKDKMRHVVRQFLKEHFGKKPLLEIHLIRI